MTRLLIVGPPGAGKGTQAKRIAEEFGIPDVSTGDIFRQNIKDGTDLGRKVQALVDAGNYVPDELTNELVTARLQEEDAKEGFLLDGYPRTLDQVAYLEELLQGWGHELDAVIQLVADEEEVVSRLQRRAEEQGRADDSEDAIRHRQEVYRRETSPLIAVYRDRGLLLEVDGLGEVDEVAERIRTALAGRGVRPVSDAGRA
ncbi:adenylate kinase [Clavibacter capsici]|uniref:adenylate kinase n=1 Tax=Clavibacter capsici TaxID=1874630 RepID=UPI001427FEA1|nr:adenylate kinase [Clavibacter capsici]QIS39972.1 adenylate kinase [Clavibacter capsici]